MHTLVKTDGVRVDTDTRNQTVFTAIANPLMIMVVINTRNATPYVHRQQIIPHNTERQTISRVVTSRQDHASN